MVDVRVPSVVTPLLSRDSAPRSRVVTTTMKIAFAAAGVLGVLVAATTLRSNLRSDQLQPSLGGSNDVEGGLGYYKHTRVLPHLTVGEKTPMLTYTLHLGCHDTSQDAAFFAEDIVEARIVHHKYGEDEQFFDWESGIPMKISNLFPGDTMTFEVVTTEVNWEYGFAIKNAAGAMKYEIGTYEARAPLAGNDECANMFGEYWNRIIGWDSRTTIEPGYIDFVFGTCRRNCIPTGDPHSWGPEERKKNTAMMLSNPPKGLGSAFKMYGSADKGWCSLNIHTQRGDSDDLMLSFNPWATSNDWALDDATNCVPWVGKVIDPNGHCQWTSNIERPPWNPTEMGVPTGGSTTKWLFEFTYLLDGVGITLNGKPFYTFKWRNADAGYDSVSYIQMNGGVVPNRVYMSGDCDLVASAHPRPVIDNPESMRVGAIE
jgi:hypothetical protein